MSSPIDTYTEEDIMGLNMGEAIKLCTQCGIEWENMESLDDYKSLLLKKLQGHDGNPDIQHTQSIKEKLKHSIVNYASMRKRVTEMYNDLRAITRDKSFDDYIRKGILKQYKKYKRIMESNLHDLSLDDCPIVVTGETSAGKSSLLNQLLGDNILPTSVLRCTSAICRLRNSERKRVVIKDYDGDSREFADIPDEELMGKVKEYTSVQAGKNAERVKYVDIYWPIPMLQENIVIVDTPGIGTSDQLTERLVEYLPNAVAFVYVINSPNDGGLQTDRLVKVIEQQLKWKKEGKLQTFDSSTAIFVCNKWDLIPKTEETDVWEDIKSKLKRYWPGMQESQLFKLCVQNMRRRHVEEFNALMESLQRLVLASLELKIKRHIEWLMEFVECVYHLIASKMNISKMGFMKRVQEIIKTKGMIKALQNKVEVIQNDVVSEINDICKGFAHRLSNHLHTEDTLEKMFNWVEDDCPSVETYYRTVYDVKRKAWKIILTRVEDEVFEWTNHNNDIKCSHEMIVSKITGGYQELEQELVDIQEIMEGQKKNIKDKMESPAQLMNLSRSRYRSFIDFFLEFIVFGSGPEKYTQDRLGYMNQWTNEAIEWLTENRVKKCLDKMCFADVVKTAEYVFETSLGNRIQADSEVLDELWNFQESYDVTRSHYGLLLLKCESLAGQMELFNIKHLSKSNIDNTRIKKNKKIGEGAFGIVYGAEFFDQTEWVPAAVKVSRRPHLEAEIYGLLLEIRCLLSLKHENILKMHGYTIIEEEEGITLQIITELCKCPLDKEITQATSCSSKCNGDEFIIRFQRFSDIGKQICAGLEFIHKAGYLHRDLKLENILVKEVNEVKTYKISDVGLAKPQNLTTGTYTGTPLYMAPEVILNNYNPTPSAIDIYSFAFILWEIWYGMRIRDIDVYANPKLNLRDFVASGGRPDFKKERKPIHSIMRIIQSCWDPNPEERPTAQNVRNDLCEIEGKKQDLIL